MNIIDGLGFIGILLILTAYFLHENGKLSNKNLTFILLNLIGAAMACLASILLEYIPFILLEGAWTLVSLNSLIKYLQIKS
jgi:hypothetical protein